VSHDESALQIYLTQSTADKCLTLSVVHHTFYKSSLPVFKVSLKLMYLEWRQL